MISQAHADPNEVNNFGRTALHEACQGGHDDVVELLLNASANYDLADSEGQTAAHMAAFQGEIKCLQSLTDKGTECINNTLSGKPLHEFKHSSCQMKS